MIRIISFIFFLLMSFYCHADGSNYYADHEQGWHWYQDPKEDETQKNNLSDPVSQMSAVQQAIKRSLDKAVLNPTEKNVTDYLILQNQMMNQSNQFSSAWKRVLLEHPELDYSIIHPTNNAALQIEHDQENQKEIEAIHHLATQSGLFFFYKSTCPYCQKFSPILKDFSEKYGISVIPITTDGISLREYPNSYVDKGQAQKFQVYAEPALFAVNPYTHKAYPVSFGLMSATDLKKRILEIASYFERNNQ